MMASERVDEATRATSAISAMVEREIRAAISRHERRVLESTAEELERIAAGSPPVGVPVTDPLTIAPLEGSPERSAETMLEQVRALAQSLRERAQ
jgi:hypothetical protein